MTNDQKREDAKCEGARPWSVIGWLKGLKLWPADPPAKAKSAAAGVKPKPMPVPPALIEKLRAMGIDPEKVTITPLGPMVLTPCNCVLCKMRAAAPWN